MDRRIQGLTLVVVGVTLLFPKIFSWDIFKFILAAYLIWMGVTLIFKKGEKKIEDNPE